MFRFVVFLVFFSFVRFCFLGGLGLGNACPGLDNHPARPPAHPPDVKKLRAEKLALWPGPRPKLSPDRTEGGSDGCMNQIGHGMDASLTCAQISHCRVSS